MKKHEHKKENCKHQLKHCDVVYCSKCEKEWGKKKVEYIKIPVYEKYEPEPKPWPVSPVWVSNTDNLIRPVRERYYTGDEIMGDGFGTILYSVALHRTRVYSDNVS